MASAAHLASLKLRVRAGTYKVDPAAVADAMLNRSSHYNGRQRVTSDQRSLIRAMDYLGEAPGDIARTVGVCLATVKRVIDEHERPPVYHRSRH